MKALKIEVEIRPVARPGKGGTGRRIAQVKTRFFQYVEGEAFGYRTTIHNVGDETIRAADTLGKLEFRWKYANGQGTSMDFLLPAVLEPGGSHAHDWVHHEVLSSGVVDLLVRAHSAAGSPADVAIQDSRGEVVPFVQAGFVRGNTVHAVAASGFAFEHFRALSRTEVLRLRLRVEGKPPEESRSVGDHDDPQPAFHALSKGHLLDEPFRRTQESLRERRASHRSAGPSRRDAPVLKWT